MSDRTDDIVSPITDGVSTRRGGPPVRPALPPRPSPRLTAVPARVTVPVSWIVKVWQNQLLDQYAGWEAGGRHSPNALGFGPHAGAELVEECSACAVLRVGSGRR